MDQLDQQHERIQDDLRGLIVGEVRCDNVFLQLYASDGSIYEIKPLGVVLPRHSADVGACVKYAAAKRIPIHARGAGSGLTGGSLGPGLVIDFSKYLRRIIRIDSETVRVQPGIACERLNAHLRRRGRIFGPDPGTSNVTTVGGMIAVDGAGRHWLRYGLPRDHIRSLQVVLADGRLMEAGREPLPEGVSNEKDPAKRKLIDRLAQLLRRHADLIRKKQNQGPVNCCGYKLTDVLGDGYLDLARLLAGSEGTLALTTEALLHTEPAPLHRGVTLLLFDSLEKAAWAVLGILPYRPSTCDLMDRRHLSLARETEVRFDLLIPRETEAVLLVEQEGERQSEVHDKLHRLVDEIQGKQQLAFGARHAFDDVEMELFRQLAVKIQPALYRMKGTTRPVPVVEDFAVPPEKLPEFFVQLQNVLKRHQVTAAMSCHAGQGQLHVHPFLDMVDQGHVQLMRSLADELYEEVFRVGGTISGERGCGLSRTAHIRWQYAELYNVFRTIKRMFDPNKILNPDKIISNDRDLLTRNLRPIAPPPGMMSSKAADQPELRDLTELQLNWDPGKVVEAARQCNVCGECRSQSADVRMCPIFRILPAEEASPRAKANLIHGVLTGTLDLANLTSDEFKTIADLCIHCRMCTLECPAGVDIPKLMTEGKAAYVAAKGLPPVDWLMTRLDLVAALGSMVRPLANWAIGNWQMRWLMEKTLGIAQQRKLPRLASPSFIRRAARRRLTKSTRRSGQKVVYFVDTYANYFDPQLPEALLAVLEHNGVGVYVPADQKQAGTAAIACGALDHARRLARHNVAVLAEAVRQGYHVVATEPAAASSLIHEYVNLLDDEDSRLIAENTSEACTYLWKLHTMGKLQLDLKPINATLGYHLPCRLKALSVGSPGHNLLGLIPGLLVHAIEEGCSGMAGTFGLKRQNYRTSLRAGWKLISRLRDPTLQAGVTECSACKIQMEQGTTKPTIHPIKLLALAYGLMPETAALLSTPGKELTVT